MIISRTPLRISFVGGGTDLPDFADEHGGAVVSTAIDKYIHAIVAPRFEGDIRVSYSRTEIVPMRSPSTGTRSSAEATPRVRARQASVRSEWRTMRVRPPGARRSIVKFP